MSKRKDMIEALAASMNREMVPWLIEWIRDTNRKEAIHAFTEGPVRQVAYAVEYALKIERDTTPVLPHLTLRSTEQCPRCGFVKYVTDRPNAKAVWLDASSGQSHTSDELCPGATERSEQ